MHRIIAVQKGSPAERRGIRANDTVLSINGEELMDIIDYQALTAKKHVCILIVHPDGSRQEYDFIKEVPGNIGLEFEETLSCTPRLCANHCLFCFVDQLPKGMRESLYIKDDDWRLSLMMGNFITLTNLGDREFARLLKRKASPLYISVHASHPDVRIHLTGNPHAGKIMSRLEQLKSNGLQFHCQAVLCPGINDGAVLQKTIDDLMSLIPNALSFAVVPVGLTKFRDGLTSLNTFSREQAKSVIEICQKNQQIALSRYNTHFVYPSDEFYNVAGLEIPEAESYEGFPQLENGVGMLRLFEDELKQAYMEHQIKNTPLVHKTVLLPCGVSAYPYLKKWLELYPAPGIMIKLKPIVNHFFGESVTVSGLLCAVDILSQCKGIKADEILIADNMLNHDQSLFLDDRTPEDLQSALGIPLRIFPNNGDAFYKALLSPIEASRSIL